MANETRTADQIERDIEDERARMRDTLNDLQQKLSLDSIVADIGGLFRGQGDIARSVSETVGRNPAAVALVGVGLAWLWLGRDRTTPAASGTQDTGRPSGQGRSDPAPGMMGAVRDATNAVGDAVSDTASAVGEAASALTDRLSAGLEGLSDDAKARVLAARRAAHDARLSSAAAVKDGARAATGFFEDQPLVVGALALALGAAIGGVLQRSKIEDDTMGDSSDQLFADAQALYRQERDKATAAPRTAASDVKHGL